MIDADRHGFTAAACLSASVIWANSDSEPHRAFAPTLALWAENAARRAELAKQSQQPDLFA